MILPLTNTRHTVTRNRENHIKQEGTEMQESKWGSLKINTKKTNTVILGCFVSECLKSLLAYEEIKQTFNSPITDNLNFGV